jgi:hypothetical protein
MWCESLGCSLNPESKVKGTRFARVVVQDDDDDEQRKNGKKSYRPP